MPAYLSSLSVWIVLTLMVLVGVPGALRPLAVEAEEVEAAEAACVSETTPTCMRIRRFFAPTPQSHGIWAPRVSGSCLRALQETHLSIASRGHMLPNGLNAPLLT
jgi:hypothetical protein